jgi:hypothetical protein
MNRRKQRERRSETVTDTTLPTSPVERELVWHAPTTKCDREADYRTVWRTLNERSKTS